MIRWRAFPRYGASEKALGEIEASDQRGALAAARARWPNVELVVISLAELEVIAEERAANRRGNCDCNAYRRQGYCRHVTRAQAAS